MRSGFRSRTRSARRPRCLRASSAARTWACSKPAGEATRSSSTTGSSFSAPSTPELPLLPWWILAPSGDEAHAVTLVLELSEVAPAEVHALRNRVRRLGHVSLEREVEGQHGPASSVADPLSH